MDNFKKQIKENYKSEFVSPDPELAWMKFEKENFSEKRRPVFFWQKSLMFVLILAAVSTLLYFTGLETHLINQDEPKILTPENEESNETISSSVASQIAKESVNNQNKATKTSINSLEANQKFLNESPSIFSSDKTYNRYIKNNETAFNTFNNHDPITDQNFDKKKKQYSQDAFSQKESNTNNNNIAFSANIKKLPFLKPKKLSIASVPLAKFNIDSLSDQENKSEKKQKRLKPYLGVAIGVNNLQHRLIYAGRGTNYGLLGGVNLNDRLSLRTQLHISQRQLNTYYNSRDLRISSVLLRSINTITEDIEKDYLQFNIALSLNYSILNLQKYFVDLSVGIQNKWDIKQNNKYSLNDGINMYSETIELNSNFPYPLFHAYSIGFGIHLFNGSSLVFRPYFATQLTQLDNKQPTEYGVQAEFIYQF